MPRLRRRLVALVIALPLLLIAYLGWSVADEPLVYLKYRAAGKSEPLWVLAEAVITACLPIVVLAIILGALVVAFLRARRERTWAAAGNVVVAAIVVMGPAAGIAGHLDSPAAHPRLYLLALALSVLVGIAILANAAARAQPDRRVAGLTVVPAAILSTVLLATFVALVAYTADLAINGVPLLADLTLGVHAYPIEALPSGYTYWLPTLTVSVLASLAALSAATYATAGSIRCTNTEATSDIDTFIDLDTITG